MTVLLALVCFLTGDLPIKVARVLDDGSTQLQRVERNALGKPTKTVDPLGRTAQYDEPGRVKRRVNQWGQESIVDK